LAGLSRKADELIDSRGLKIRVNFWERLKIIILMWKESAGERLGRQAWFVVLARQGLQRLCSFSRFVSRPT
jgi:hypothetical protein